MSPRVLALWLCAVCAAGFASEVRAAEPPTAGSDVVLLLDESGSMRQTDPQDARIDAASLFLRLCRPSDCASVVGFASNLRVLGKLGAMGPGAERERLLRLAREIRSTGQWTDIEKSLEQSLSLFARQERGATRAVVLMTDGKVDLGRGAEEDRLSAERIRGPLAKRFAQSGTAVHCVAFSPQADLVLLSALSNATGGLCVRGDNPDDLQRVFVRFFEEIAQPQTAPLADGKVVLDRSVREATFLITHPRDAAKPTCLVRPDAKSFTARDFDRYPGVNWFSAPAYDLVTIAQPPEGCWRVEPTPDNADSRVMLLTDVELHVDRFEASVRAGEKTPLVASLRTEGKTIAAPEWIDAVSMHATLRTTAAESLEMKDDGQHDDGSAGDGAFGVSLAAPTQLGPYDVELVARTPTLERRVVRVLNVADRWFGVALHKEVLEAGEKASLTVVVAEDAPLLKPGQSHQFAAEVEGPGGLRKNVEARALDQPGRYGIVFDDTSAEGDYRVSVVGRIRQGEGSFLDDSVGPLDFRVTPKRSAMVLPPIAAATPSPALTPTEAPRDGAAQAHTPAVSHEPPPVSDRAVEKTAARPMPPWIVPGAAAASALVALAAASAWVRRLRRRAAVLPSAPAPVAAAQRATSRSAPTVLADAPTLVETASDKPPPVPVPPVPEEEPGQEAESPPVAAVADKKEAIAPVASPCPAPQATTEEADAPTRQHAPDGAEIIPEAGDDEIPPEFESGSEPLVAKKEVDSSLTQDDLAEKEPAPANARQPAPEPTPTLSDAERALLAEIMGGSAESFLPPSPSPPISRESRTQPAPEPLDSSPKDKNGGQGGSERAPASPSLASGADARWSKTAKERPESGIPTIPEGLDSRSDKEVIDDILREIQRGDNARL